MSTGPTYKQDLPPPGGYKAIPFLRVPAKQYFSGLQMLIIFNIVTFSGLWYWRETRKTLRNWVTEDRSTRFALQPMLFAEKDRAYLKRLRKLREEETELMKDVPGWVVGTYWGEPIYFTRPEDEWHDVNPNEFWAHTFHSKRQFWYNFYKYM